MKVRSFFSVIVWTTSTLLFCSAIAAQTPTKIRGTVSDAATGEPLPYANVTVLPKTYGITVSTKDDGKYAMEFTAKGESLQFSFVGYEPLTVKLTSIKDGVLNVKLKPLDTRLEEVVVTGEHTRYRNRDNPAVELIRKVIDNKDKNRIESHDTYEYERYERIQLSLSVNDSIRNSTMFRKFPFFNNYLDTLENTERKVLPVFLRENISEHYFRKKPSAEKEYLIASRMTNFHDFIEEQTVSSFLDGMVRRSNIYDNRIIVLENEYLSPLSPLAPNFYRFHILDTVDISGVPCVNLSVYPRNEQDFGFRGNLYILTDSSYALKRAELGFTSNNNVNFVNDFSLIQEYTLIDSTWCLTFDEAVIDFSLNKKKSMILGKRINTYENYKFDHRISETTFIGGAKVDKIPGYDMRAEQYWTEHRPVPLARSEQGIYDMLAEMKSNSWFRNIFRLAGIVFSGYIDAGPIDVGPMATLYSFNEVEGSRIRVGGKTNTRFSKNIFFEGYGAYGFKDDLFKYSIGTMFSFSKRKVHPWEYPMNLLSISYTNDIETPGQAFLFGSADRLLMSFHRGHSQQMVYHQTLSAKYEKEFPSGLSLKPSFTHKEEQPAGSLTFENAYGPVHDVTTSQVGLMLRYAPNERFYQVQRNRFPLNHTNPVFTVNYNYGIKDFWESDYTFHRLEVGIDKRNWFSSLGFSDVWLKAGKIWGTVSFPQLVIHQANQNYAYQDEAFNMMNYMEFVSDQYVSANLSYCFNGWIFNRIPLIKKLKWREFITFKALWGSVSDQNKPENNPDILRFPVNNQGVPTMYSLEKGPYMEASVAIDNLFKVLRIDLVKRISYLDHPDIAEWGVRFRVRFVF